MSEAKSKTVSLHTLGCRLNLSETGHIAQQFKERGYEVVDFGTPADIVFLNTCTVTDSADSTCRNLIRKAHKVSPEGKIIVSGCYAQMEPQKVAQMQGVDLVLGTNEKFKVFDYLEEEESQIIKVDQTNEFWGAATTPADFHTRAFLKIQDGCNYICSFCIIPFARGRSRAIKIAQACKQAQLLVQQGFKEVVLTGVNIGEYDSASGEKLTHLIAELLQIEGLERLRLSSVEPNTIDHKLLEVLKASPKFMDHFHIPLQSGDDQILKNMRRKYNSSQYKDILAMVKSYFPRAGIGADIILGFPGETTEQFARTYEFLQEVPVTHFHVFPYSKRKNTTAARMPEQIHHQTKKERVHKIIELGEQKLKKFANSMVGQNLEVLFEKEIESNIQQEGLKGGEGLTSNYLKTRAIIPKEIQVFPTHAPLKNTRAIVHINAANSNELIGTITKFL